MVCWPSAKQLHQSKEDKSAASFGRQVAAWVPDMFCNFYLTKNHKIANNSTNTDATRTNEHRFWNLRIFRNFFMCVWLNLKTIKLYVIKSTADWERNHVLAERCPLLTLNVRVSQKGKRILGKGKIKVQHNTSFAGATTFSTTAFSIMTLGIMGLATTLSISNYFFWVSHFLLLCWVPSCWMAQLLLLCWVSWRSFSDEIIYSGK